MCQKLNEEGGCRAGTFSGEGFRGRKRVRKKGGTRTFLEYSGSEGPMKKKKKKKEKEARKGERGAGSFPQEGGGSNHMHGTQEMKGRHISRKKKEGGAAHIGKNVVQRNVNEEKWGRGPGVSG